MKNSSLTTLIVAAGIASGCGARTSEDDLLDYSRPVQTGGDSAVTGGSGGLPVGGTGGLPGPTGGSGNECCTTSELAGCNNSFIEACVCDIDTFCCDSSWDQACVDRASQSCSASCIGGTGGMGAGGMPTTGGAGGTMPTGGTGGGVPITGGAGGSLPTGGSGGSLPGGDCCDSHGGQGCQVMSVQQCVCSEDPYCCNSQWDQLCADRAPSCGADCGIGGTGGMGTGGISGTGGMGTGGLGTGGISGTGGLGTGGMGSETCQSLFPGSCGSCLCTKCFTQLTQCLNDDGCTNLLACTLANQCGCSGIF